MSLELRYADLARARYRDEADDRPAPVDRHEGRPPPGKRTLVSRVYRAAAGPAPSGPDVIAALERAAAAAGRSLPPELRAQLERALGVSLADVRVHDDSASADAARAIAARAYTVGQDVHFARGAYAPEDPEGRRLIAHEVAHAVQHGGQAAAPAAGGELALSQPGDAAELEADRFADDFASGRAATPPSPPSLGGVARAVIHRDADTQDRDAEHEDALAKVQGKAMYALLPALRDLEPSAARGDEQAGYKVGGRRLVIAQRAVRYKGKWADFVAGQQEALAGLPGNQVSDIMAFLGAPDGAAYYDKRKFDNRFDGMIDPGARKITLFWRVKVEAGPNAKLGPTAEVGPPNESDPDRQTELQKNQQKQHEAFQRETKAAIEAFKKDLPGAIQKTWKARIKPAEKIGKVAAGSSFDCSVVVTVVDSGEHRLVQVLPDENGARSSMPKDQKKPGMLRDTANQPRTRHQEPVGDSTGKLTKKIDLEQTGSAHEFGHAIGLEHPVCESHDDRCYGVTEAQKSSAMGMGDDLTRTGGKHDDFAAFARIGAVWSAEQGVATTWSP